MSTPDKPEFRNYADAQLLAGDAAGVNAIIDSARAVAQPIVIGHEDLQKPIRFVIPANAQLVEPDLSDYMVEPTRKKGTVRPSDVNSLIRYVKRHYVDVTTTVWVDADAGVIEAIVDDHAGEGPDWRQHRAELQLKETPEWTYWTSKDGEMMSQIAFAEHLEEGMDQIAEPDAATLLEIAQNFHAKNDVSFRSSTRLASGEQRLQYDETIQASAGATGELTVPTMFMLVLSPYEGEDGEAVAARLRFRVQGGKLFLGYKLDQPQKVKSNTLEKIWVKLSDEFPATFMGKPD